MYRRISGPADHWRRRPKSLRNLNAATPLTSMADSPMLANLARGRTSATTSKPVVPRLRLDAWVGSTTALPPVQTASRPYGTIQPLDTAEREATTCRRTVIYNEVGSASGTSRFPFCNQGGGNWRRVQ